jgi:DNA modification methylase
MTIQPGRKTMPAADLLAQLNDDQAGIMITDPPWDLDGGTKFDECASYDRLDLQSIANTLQDARRVLQPGAHLYLFAPASSSFFPIIDAFKDRGWHPIRLLSWGNGNDSGLGAYRNAFEPILILSNGPSRGYPGPPNTYPSLLKQKIPHGRTAKPWQLYRIFLKMSAKPGELAIDPYCGTNPPAQAIRRLNRQQPWIATDTLTPQEVNLDLANLEPTQPNQTQQTLPSTTEHKP